MKTVFIKCIIYILRIILEGTTATYGGVYGVAPTQPVYSYSAAPTPYEQVYLPRQCKNNYFIIFWCAPKFFEV